MSIRFKCTSGPLEGKVFEYARAKTAITFGRLEDRDVRFPADFRSISRAHLTVELENDRYYLRPDEPVFIDGHEAMRDDELPKKCELRLGSPTGPAFQVEWNILSDMPSTEAPFKRPRQSPARAALQATQRVRMIALAAVGLVLVTAAAVAAYFLMQPEPFSAKLDAARPSVYMVIYRRADGYERNGGTAWVIAPGTLATNAHVVDGILSARAKGETPFVRSNVPPFESIAITSAVKHPHYDRFTSAVGYYAPVAPGGRLVTSTLGYDVGLIRVAANAKLAPPLKVASRETLLELAPSQEVAYIGYPTERMAAGGVNLTQPTPQTHIARISAVTDFFLASVVPADRLLIQHSLPGAGGCSGSPIFNSRGEVIALFNAGNVIHVPIGNERARIPTVLINFAQRADLVREILDVKLETIAHTREEEWKKRLRALPSAPDFLIQSFQRDTGSTGALPVLDTTLTVQPVSGQKNPAAGIQYEIPGAGAVHFQALGSDTGTVFLHVHDAADPTKLLGSRTSSIHYPWVRLTQQEAAKVTVTVLSTTPGKRIRLRVFFVPKKA